MVIPDTFGVRGERAIVSYDFINFSSGTGTINLYAGNSIDKKLLSNVTYYSNSILTSGTEAGTTLTKKIDIDFDVFINKPLTIEGITIVNIPSRYTFLNGVYAGSGKIVARLRQWDGSTETEIANNEATGSGNNVITYKMLSIDLTIPKTHYKIGDTLRLTIEGWIKTNTSGSSGCSVAVAHDPMNRTTGWDTSGVVPSKLTFQMPVRIDV